MSVIVAISGGKASTYCAYWALENYKKDNVILYFNDTKWEHKDLYRFLSDIEDYLHHKILVDADGRNPEQLFYDNKALANNRMPFCSRILKAERLQNYYKNNDTLVFGIGSNELNRVDRLIKVYQLVYAKSNKYCSLRFPLVEENINSEKIDIFFDNSKINIPELYKLGFIHNNCSGGCVRAGKRQWKMLFEKLPIVYYDRMRVENNIRKYLNKDVHFFKDETLESFKNRIITGELSSYYDDTKNENVECFGICETMN